MNISIKKSLALNAWLNKGVERKLNISGISNGVTYKAKEISFKNWNYSKNQNEKILLKPILKNDNLIYWEVNSITKNSNI